MSENIAREYWDDVLNWNSKVKWLHKNGMQSKLFKLEFDKLPAMAKRRLAEHCQDGYQPEDDGDRS